MTSATITSKGQVTIPAEVRAELGLRSGSRLTFVPTGRGGYEIHRPRRLGEGPQGRRAHAARARVPVTIEEMNDAIAAGAVDL